MYPQVPDQRQAFLFIVSCFRFAEQFSITLSDATCCRAAKTTKEQQRKCLDRSLWTGRMHRHYSYIWETSNENICRFIIWIICWLFIVGVTRIGTMVTGCTDSRRWAIKQKSTQIEQRPLSMAQQWSMKNDDNVSHNQNERWAIEIKPLGWHRQKHKTKNFRRENESSTRQIAFVSKHNFDALNSIFFCIQSIAIWSSSSTIIRFVHYSFMQCFCIYWPHSRIAMEINDTMIAVAKKTNNYYTIQLLFV